MTYVFNNTKLIFDEESKKTLVATMISAKNERITLENKTMLITKHDMMIESLLADFFPKELADMITGYYDEIIENIFNTFMMRSKHQYNIHGLFDENQNDIILIFNNTCIERMLINSESPISITEENMACVQYILDNNLFQSLITLDIDELWSECRHVSKNVLHQKSFFKFFNLMVDVIEQKQYELLIILTVLYNDFKKWMS